MSRLAHPFFGTLEFAQFPLDPPQSLPFNQSDRRRFGRESHVSIVLTQHQAVLGPTGEHPIRLGAATGHEVVHHDAEVGLVAPQNKFRLAFDLQRSVRPSDQPLPGGLFIAGGAIDLTRKVQTFDLLRFEGRAQLSRRAIIVLDRVARAQNFAALETGDRSEKLQLHLVGQRGGNAIHIILEGVPTFGFEENLVPLLFCEADDFVLDRRAITRPHPLDHAAVHRRLVQICADRVVGAGVGVSDPAGQLFHVERGVTPRIEREKVIVPTRDGVGHEAEFRRWLVAILTLAAGKIDGSTIQSARGAGLEALDREAQALQRLGHL